MYSSVQSLSPVRLFATPWTTAHQASLSILEALLFLFGTSLLFQCPVLTVASWPVYRFLKRQVRWSGIPISFRIFHSLLWTCTKPIECPTPRINPNVNYRLCMIMICQCRFIRCNKCTTLVEDVGNGVYHTCLGSGDIREICVHFSQFCYKLKSASKNVFNSSQRRKII